MGNVCKWTFRFRERGRITYDTSCGRTDHHHNGYAYCPYCGKILEVDRESEKKVERCTYGKPRKK